MTKIWTPLDPLATAPRYTTAAMVKARMKIPSGNLDLDSRITSAIIAAEYALDAELGHAFPELGYGLASGEWLLGAGAAAPPGAHEIIHTGDAAVFLDRSDIHGAEPSGTIADRATLYDLADVHAVAVNQPGAAVVLDVTSLTDETDYLSLVTTLDSGAWAAFVPGYLTTVALLTAKYPAAIPPSVVEAAASVAHAVYKLGDAPAGTAGSDDWLGAIDVGELARREISRSPLLRGFKTSAGFGVA